MIPTLTVTLDTGVVLSTWRSIDLDSDLFVPADSMSLAGPATQGGKPISWEEIKTSNRITATLDGKPVFAGSRTRAENEIDAGRDELTLEGMDAAKVLVDCASSTPFRKPAGNLSVYAQTLCKALGVAVRCDPSFVIPAPSGGGGNPVTGTDATVTESDMDGISASPTEPVWSILDRICKRVGAWIWCDPDGTVRIQSLKAFYTQKPVDSLILPAPGTTGDGRVLSCSLRDDSGERFSHVYVRGSTGQRAKNTNKATGSLSASVLGQAADAELVARGIYRPQVIQDPEEKSAAKALARAQRELAIQRVQGNKIELTVRGFMTASGVPWQAMAMVEFNAPAKGISGSWFIAARRFFLDEDHGSRTKLTLVQSGVL